MAKHVDLWKNVQTKKEIKKNNSEIINMIVLNFNIILIQNVWYPINVLSRIISRNRKILIIIKLINIINIMEINLKSSVRNFKVLIFEWNKSKLLHSRFLKWNIRKGRISEPSYRILRRKTKSVSIDPFDPVDSFYVVGNGMQNGRQ